MIHVTVDESGSGLEIEVDNNGVDELIRYLESIKKSKDHIHLTVGNELSEEKTTNKLISHIKIAFR